MNIMTQRALLNLLTAEMTSFSTNSGRHSDFDQTLLEHEGSLMMS